MAETAVISREKCERQFRKAGLPLLIEDYSAREDIFTRALPFLAFIFLLEMGNAVQLRWSVVQNVLAAIGGLLFLVLAFGVINRIRGRRFFSLPHSVGRVELGAFVLLPALLPLIFNQHAGEASVIILQNLLLLLVVYGIVGFSLFSVVRWAASRALSQLVASLSLAARAIPLLLFFSMITFLTTEMWQVTAYIESEFGLLLVALIVLVDGAFIGTRLPREVSEFEKKNLSNEKPLTKVQRANVGLVIFVSQSLQVLGVTLATAAFYFVIGALAVGPDVLDQWLGSTGNSLLNFDLLGHEVVITEELLRMVGAIALLSGLYYSISVATDNIYRNEFMGELTEEMEETFKLRKQYLELVR